VASLRRRKRRGCWKREYTEPRRTSTLGEWLKVEGGTECMKVPGPNQKTKLRGESLGFIEKSTR
jgi:hypothetical protein